MTLCRILVLVGFLVDIHGLNATNKERHYVKENESVILKCPYMPRSDTHIVWIKSNTKIAEGRNVNINNKYSITGNNSREQNLRIANISQENIGEYRCDVVKNGRSISYTFELIFCSIPHNMNNYNLNVDSNDGHVKNMYCERTQMEVNHSNDHIMQGEKVGDKFTCAALTNKQCLTADTKFMVQIFWSDNSKNKCTVHTVNSNSNVIYVVCSCNYSKPTGEFLTKTFDGLYHVDTLYLKNILTLDISHCHCDVVSDDSQCKNDLLGSGQRLHMGASLTLSLAVLCIFVAIGIYMYIIRDKESPTRRICQTWNRALAHNIINKPVKQEQDEQLQKLPLNYIDVMFDSTHHSSKFYIRGDNDKTPYAEIGFTLHADPLPDIDSSEGDDGESDYDFMSLSGIQNGMQPS